MKAFLIFIGFSLAFLLSCSNSEIKDEKSRRNVDLLIDLLIEQKINEVDCRYVRRPMYCPGYKEILSFKDRIDEIILNYSDGSYTLENAKSNLHKLLIEYRDDFNISNERIENFTIDSLNNQDFINSTKLIEYLIINRHYNEAFNNIHMFDTIVPIFIRDDKNNIRIKFASYSFNEIPLILVKNENNYDTCMISLGDGILNGDIFSNQDKIEGVIFLNKGNGARVKYPFSINKNEILSAPNNKQTQLHE